ncbi:MAG: hypothetical protein SVQ76_00630 [Candidatus Nanohaloarchaea archaeon]|nr:hypothetical protein [Candidatus Nanohaloarchaea archaeon]
MDSVNDDEAHTILDQNISSWLSDAEKPDVEFRKYVEAVLKDERTGQGLYNKLQLIGLAAGIETDNRDKADSLYQEILEASYGEDNAVDVFGLDSQEAEEAFYSSGFEMARELREKGKKYRESQN